MTSHGAANRRMATNREVGFFVVSLVALAAQVAHAEPDTLLFGDGHPGARIVGVHQWRPRDAPG